MANSLFSRTVFYCFLQLKHHRRLHKLFIFSRLDLQLELKPNDVLLDFYRGQEEQYSCRSLLNQTVVFPSSSSFSLSVHLLFLHQVNEGGTEAAASTGVVLVYWSAAIPRDVTFTVDHPFLFLIR